MTIQVDYSNMSLATQLMTRQQSHAQHVSEHLEQYAQLSRGDLGLILQLLQPINQGAVDVGKQIMVYSGQTFELGSQKMADSAQAYLDADTQTYEEFRQVLAGMGIDAAPYTPPTPVTLGPAGDKATAEYSMPDGDLFHQAFWDGYQSVQWMDQTSRSLEERLGAAMSETRVVGESVDASSFLTAPQVEDPEIENIRWSAGLIFGGVDWIFEQLFGYSLLEEMTKPFTGNWTEMNEAASAWTHTGDALTAIARNTSGMVPPMASWTGAGSEAFLGAAAVVAEGHLALQGPAGIISSVLKAIATLAKMAASKILSMLKRVQDRLLMMAAEAAVPVAGWVAAGITAGITFLEVVEDVRWAYKWINRVYDVVSSATSGLDQIVSSRLVMVDLYEGLARAAAARAA